MSRMVAVMRLRCPNCLDGAVFSGLWDMYERCPICGIQYKREDGYFMNSIFIGYVLAFFFSLPPIVLLYLLRANFLTFVLGVTITLVLLSPLIVRYSRVIWMHLDELMDPRRTS